MSSACVCHYDQDNCWYCQSEIYKRALEEIDLHITNLNDPLPNIIEIIGRTLN